MSDISDFTRLTELLISRQDQQQQQLELLTTGVLRLTEQAADHKLLITQNQERIAQNERTIELFGDVQQRIINQLELIYTEQQRFNEHQERFNERQEQFNERQEQFNERQERFNERQDQFNILFLDEFRDLKHDIRVLRDVTLKQYDERIQRLEDFMNGFMRKAG